MSRYYYLFMAIPMFFLFESLRGGEKTSFTFGNSKSLLMDKGPRQFKIIQEGFIYGSFNLPVHAVTPEGSMNMGFGAGFDGTVFFYKGIGIVTNFSFSYQNANLDTYKGGSYLYWAMPGVKYSYDFEDTYKRRMAWECAGLAGISVFKPIGSFAEIGTSGSLGLGVETGFTYNFLRLAVRYVWAHPSFEYTIYPKDYVSSLVISYFQINVGYTFSFTPRFRPK